MFECNNVKLLVVIKRTTHTHTPPKTANQPNSPALHSACPCLGCSPRMDGQTDGRRGLQRAQRTLQAGAAQAGAGRAAQAGQRSARRELLHHKPRGSRFLPRMPAGPRHAAPRPSCLEKPFCRRGREKSSMPAPRPPSQLQVPPAPARQQAQERPTYTPSRGRHTSSPAL